MKKNKLFTLILAFGFALTVYAQETENFYATMALQDALELKNDLPDEVEILEKYRNEAAVYMSPEAGHYVHDKVLVHGPGYIFKANKEAAIAAIKRGNIESRGALMAYTITEDAFVNQALDVINTQNIEDHILELEAYGTRYHNRASATQAAVDLKAKWEAMAASYGRTDVSVRLFNHVNTQMPSVIMTIEGAEIPDEYVIVGGHLDSTSNQGNNDAPGGDDDASGIATITEATRALFEIGFTPKRTIEVMAYAAEEIGLVGSEEIAQEYSSNNVNVTSVVQFDMTNYNGSANDISFITDYTNSELNGYLMQLLDHYNAAGSHQVTYATSLCNYGCSDHASWNNEGYKASFPFEANFGDHNPNIHTASDTFAVSGTATHATKFTKLCVEYLIEASKSYLLSVDDTQASTVFVAVNTTTLTYDVTAATKSFEHIALVDMQGKQVFEATLTETKGTLSLQELPSGVYVATLRTDGKDSVSKKIIVE
ncbi:M20/M25/M40 family metallo-hydrolase [Ulvibacter litoralis]|uniref:Leucyl aminopeptidase n=1 Tax=Ulvibacter litoralis TaxID=227084 RepID=A0A1G7C0M4_9FLAO|nr:M20/M25/M40 family metallo-hydrolase [Ulvibacter litoralis]GHC49110.1 hypothetical protein GCM10008083_10710 [Ulvibacter litoralis]SDE32813.1 leucyl aminopeptidase [Ulvibacter litoralis]